MNGMPATVITRREPWTMAGNLCAEVHETHTGRGCVCWVTRHSRPRNHVVTDFLDFSTLGTSCRHACEREVVLNRRLAPDSYLGVGHFSGPAGRSGRTGHRDAPLRGLHSAGLAGQKR